jgi:hypothetical protein
MSEELPANTPDQAIRNYLNGIAWMCMLTGVEMIAHWDHVTSALIAFVIGTGFFYAAYKWEDIKTHLSKAFVESLGHVATSAEWLIALVLVVILGVIFSPYIEQTRWPYVYRAETQPSTPIQDPLPSRSNPAVSPLPPTYIKNALVGQNGAYSLSQDKSQPIVELIGKTNGHGKRLRFYILTRGTRYKLNTEITDYVEDTDIHIPILSIWSQGGEFVRRWGGVSSSQPNNDEVFDMEAGAVFQTFTVIINGADGEQTIIVRVFNLYDDSHRRLLGTFVIPNQWLGFQ